MSKYIFILIIFIFASCKKEYSSIRVNNSTIISELLEKKYNKICFLMTHNSMNNTEKGYWLPNQTHSISKQLQNGVRGLMIDTYDGNNNIAQTYHFTALTGSQNLVDVLNEVELFLKKNTNEIITIIFQNDGSNAQLIKAIEDAQLIQYVYVHNGEWKTYKEMIESNQRLVLFLERNKLPNKNYLHYAWSTIFDTEYAYTNANQFDCAVNRGENTGENKLFLINHWLSNVLSLPDKNLAIKANNRATLSKRVNECSIANNHFVNFLGVDFYEIGDAKAIVDSINAAN